MFILDNSKNVGVIGEDLARRWYVSKGYIFVGIRVPYMKTDFDLILEKAGCVYFIEVKTSFVCSKTYLSASERVSSEKLLLLKSAADMFMKSYFPGEDAPYIHLFASVSINKSDSTYSISDYSL